MNISIIGGGNLGAAIATGLKQADPSSSISVSRRNVALIRHLEKQDIFTSAQNTDKLSSAEIIIIAVKPYQVEEVLKEIAPFIKQQLIVSVVTGVSIERIRKILGSHATIFRAMPNTAIAQRESMTCISHEKVEGAQQELIYAMFKKLGDCVFIEEKLMDSATVLGASGIAFALRYIRASMQAGIQIGFDANTALLIAAQTAKGAATLLLNDTTHPEREIDKVTTPKGCTISGLNEMEHQGFSSALIQGVLTSYKAIADIQK